MRMIFSSLAVVALSLGGSPADAQNNPANTSSSVTFIGAGDIASEPWSSSAPNEQTARLIEEAIAADPNTVVWTTGDNAYPDGSANDYSQLYDPAWGDFWGSTFPVTGNHDWHQFNAQAYLDYFCPSSSNCRFPGGTQKHYYSYDVGNNWHMIAIDTELGQLEQGELQYEWVKQDLRNTNRFCIAAYWHKPRFTSSEGRSNRSGLANLWSLLQQNGVDVILNGHGHHYERFARQDADGNLDPSGIIQIITGTGGGEELSSFSSTPHANSLVRLMDRGVTKLTLRDADFDWEFINVSGAVLDSGTAVCLER